jgi:hypothetical protein
MSIDKILEERGKVYGEFVDHAALAQRLKTALKSHRDYDKVDFDMKEAMDMVLHKMARIVNGDPYYLDSWVDIVGYIELVIRRLKTHATKADIS